IPKVVLEPLHYPRRPIAHPMNLSLLGQTCHSSRLFPHPPSNFGTAQSGPVISLFPVTGSRTAKPHLPPEQRLTLPLIRSRSGFHHRNHAPVHLRHQALSRTLRNPIGQGCHASPVPQGVLPYGADWNLDPIMLPHFACG